jgi:hypothetical protein
LFLRLNQETVHDLILPFLPPCGPHLTPSNEAYLCSPHLEALLATTFRTCSSLAPTLVKPQRAPAILSQELVHTTLSITHHTKKRPSTSPRTTHGPHQLIILITLMVEQNSIRLCMGFFLLSTWKKRIC